MTVPSLKSNWRTWTICALLTAVTLAIFWPVTHHDFINYDDPQYIFENPHVLGGLSWENVQWAFTTGYASNWHPATWVSHMLDVQIFGAKPGWHHLTNLLLHVVNSVLLFLVLGRLTGALWRSALVAALFALHPLHVESVAWLAERKDVLSGCFFMLTVWAYARYVSGSGQSVAGIQAVQKTAPSGRGQKEVFHTSARPGGRHPGLAYVLALLFFALGLMSKPMLVTLPFVLLLLDYWPLKRLELGKGVTSALWPRVWEKLPFFALAIVSSAITLSVQSGAMVHAEGLPFGQRVGNAVLAYAAYLGQAFWPARLAVFYPYPAVLSAPAIAAAALLLLGVTVVVLRVARRSGFAPVGWFWYLGTLVPVIGIIQVGSQARADRYTYLPIIGIFVLCVWGAGAVLQGLAAVRQRQVVFGLVCVWVAVLASLTVVTRQQVQYWQNSETLFAHATQVTRENYIALTGLGIVDLRRGDFPGAMTNFNLALECSRSRGATNEIKYYIGAALQMQGRAREALPYLQEAIVGPDLVAEKNCRLGVCLLEAGRLEEGERAIQQALALKPELPDAQLAMAGLLQMHGKTAESEAAFRAILEAHPELPQAHRTYADFLMLQKRPAEAEVQYAWTVKLVKPDAGLFRSYGTCLAALHKNKEAIAQLEQGLALAPRDAQANFELAELYSENGQKQQALVRYDQAIEADPRLVIALNNCAWMLATEPEPALRNGKRAVELAERACQVNGWRAAFLMGTLAAAYAEAGRFPEAVSMGEKARDKARADNQPEIAKSNEELLELYRAGKPFHEPPPAAKTTPPSHRE